MTVKEYLEQKECPVNHGVLAKLMWPSNKSAKTYLSKKLNGDRPWTTNDSVLAKAALIKLAVDIKALS